MNALLKGPYLQLLTCFHAILKLKGRREVGGQSRRVYGRAQTPLARVWASRHVLDATKATLRQKKAGVNPFALKLAVDQSMKEIQTFRRRSE